MNDFGEKVENLFSELGESRNMVTSRMMSVIILDRAFYFQKEVYAKTHYDV